MSDLLQPSLRRYPDARKAPVILIEPVLLPLFGLLFGIPLVTLLACYNAAAIRRVALFFTSLALGFAGWFAFINAAALMKHTAFVLIVGRCVNFAIGCVYYFLQRPYIRGHQFLGGRVVPLRASYLAALVIAIFLPWKLKLWLMGVPVGR